MEPRSFPARPRPAHKLHRTTSLLSGFLLEPQQESASLPLGGRVCLGLGSHAESVLRHPVPAILLTCFLSSLSLCLRLTLSKGRVLFARSTTCVPWNLLLKPALTAPPSLSPSFPGPETPLDKHLLSSLGYLEPLSRPSRSSHPPPPFPPVGNWGSQLSRLRHGIRPLLPAASPHLFSRDRLLIGGSVGHSSIPHVARPYGGLRLRLLAYPLLVIAPRRVPRSSGQSPGTWKRDRSAHQRSRAKGP